MLSLTPGGNISSKKEFTSPVDKLHAGDYGVAVVLCLVQVAGPVFDPSGVYNRAAVTEVIWGCARLRTMLSPLLL